ncbi:hypothetical protein H9P43_003010 [Blastocladiella emersonii ATCC 22665]|nr:hypothetical protein H9P43_003010 [Blastocladiella emersonii ATCC 22665]
MSNNYNQYNPDGGAGDLPADQVVPEYETLMLINRSDDSLFEHMDAPADLDALGAPPAPMRQYSQLDAHGRPLPPQRFPSSTAALTGGTDDDDLAPPSNQLRIKSTPLAAKLQQAPVSLSWTDILRPLMDEEGNPHPDTSLHIENFPAPSGIHDNGGGKASDDQLLAAAASAVAHRGINGGGMSVSVPSSRSGTVRRSRSPSRDARAAPTALPPPPPLGTLHGKVVSPKVDTWRGSESPKRDRSPERFSQSAGSAEVAVPASPAAPPQLPVHQPVDADFMAIVAEQETSRARSPSATAARPHSPPLPSSLDPEVAALTEQLALSAGSRLQSTPSDAQPSSSPQRGSIAGAQPKVDTWRGESPNARRRAALEQKLRQLQQQDLEARQRDAALHAREQERIARERRILEDAQRLAREHEDNSIGVQACSLDFLVSVGAEPKREPSPARDGGEFANPPSPTAKKSAAQPKVDTWWRDGRPRSPTNNRAASPRSPSASGNSRGVGRSADSLQGQQQAAQQRVPSPAPVSSVSRNGPSAGVQATPAAEYAAQTPGPSSVRAPSPSRAWANVPRNANVNAEPVPVTAASPRITINTAQQQQAQAQQQQEQPPVRPGSPQRRARPENVAPLVIPGDQRAAAVGQQQSRTASGQGSARPAPKSAASRSSAGVVDSAIATTPASRTQQQQQFPSSPRDRKRTTSNPPALQESHGPVRAYLQQQQQQNLGMSQSGAPASPLLAPPSPTARSRKSSALAGKDAFNGSLASLASSAAGSTSTRGGGTGKQQRPLTLAPGGGPPAALAVRRGSWAHYLTHEGAYLVVLLVFLLLVFDMLTGASTLKFNKGCVQLARQLTNTGDVVCGMAV